MSVTPFSSFNFDNNIQKAIVECGYTEATPIQAKAIPIIMDESRDVIATAQTGTGKTAAFVLPILQQLSVKKGKFPSILILSPTRELALQITKAATQYGKYMRFNIVNLVGGMPYPQQIRELSRGADIIIATPGRLIDHIESKRVNLSEIQTLVLDEADRMLDMGFIEDVQYVAALTPKARQTLLFSATFDKRLAIQVRDLLKNPVRIDMSNDVIVAPKIVQTMYKTTNMQQKTRLLKQFLNEEQVYKAIIFSATKMHADKLADDLRQDGFAAAALHGDLRQNVRKRTVEQLRSGKIQYLIATDVAARGLDINDVTHVFNYDLPKFCEDYVHRIGRTGRAGKTGIAISFVSPADFKHMQRIERYLGQQIKIVKHVDVKESVNEREPFDPSTLEERGERSHGGGGRRGGSGKPAGGRGGFRKERDGESRFKREERGFSSERSSSRGEPRKEGRGEFRGARSDAAPRSQARGEGRGESRAPRSEGGYQTRAPRSEAKGESRAPRSEGRYESRAPRGEGRSENRAPRNEGGYQTRAPRSEAKGEARAPRGEGRGEFRSSRPKRTEGGATEFRSSRKEGKTSESRSGDRKSAAPRKARENKRSWVNDAGTRSQASRRFKKTEERAS